MLVYISLFIFVNIYITQSSKCNTCKKFVDHFKEELDRTQKHNYGGGNTNWEESSLPKYADSEIRFHEMIDNIHHQKNEKMSSFIEEVEELLEGWWMFKKLQFTNLHDWLCVITLKECCQPNHWGAQCIPCLMQPESNIPCTGNGECSGEGTRKGSGKCICRGGSYSSLCDKCNRGYFLTNLNSTHVNCTKCDASCLNTCTGLGADKCDACANTFQTHQNGTCLDIDECERSPDVCPAKHYCTNTYGSYKCSKCHSSCEACAGTSANCTVCAPGYQTTTTEGECEDIDECGGALEQSIAPPCPERQVCKNLPGTYKCVDAPASPESADSETTPSPPTGEEEGNGADEKEEL